MLNIAIGAKSKVWDTEQMSIRGSQIARTIYCILSDRGVVARNIDGAANELSAFRTSNRVLAKIRY